MNGPYSEPIPADARPVRAMARTAAIGRAAIKEGRTLLERRGRARTPAASAAEYQRRWSDQRLSARWRAASNLIEATAISSYGDSLLRAMLEFAAYDLPASVFFQWRARKLARIFSAHVPRDQRLVELGCGLGKNLLALAAHGYTDLVGLDVSPAAVAAVREQFHHFGIAGRADQADVLEPDTMAPVIRGQMVFTNYVLEQMTYSTAEVVDAIVQTGPRLVLHIEPCHERLPGRRAWERWPSVWHRAANDYQRGLLPVLAERQRAGRLRVFEVTALGYSPYLFHSPVLIRWEPTRE